MNICLILSCSRKKIWSKNNQLTLVEAKGAYIGNNFIKARKIAEKDTLVGNYDLKIKTKNAASAIKRDFKEKLTELDHNYDKLFLIGGNKYYRMVFEDISDNKFSFLEVKSQGDLGSQLKNILEFDSIDELIDEYFIVNKN